MSMKQEADRALEKLRDMFDIVGSINISYIWLVNLGFFIHDTSVVIHGLGDRGVWSGPTECGLG